MANILLGTFLNIVTCANDRVVSTYCFVGEFVHSRARLILRVLLFTTDKWTVLSVRVSKLLTNFWHGEVPSVASTPPLSVKENDDANDSIVTEETITENTAVTEDAVTEDTVAEDTAVTKDTVPKDTVTEDTVAGDTVTEDIVTEDTVAEDTVAEDAVAGDTVTKDPVAEDTVAEDTVTEGTVTEGTVTEDTVTGYNVTEDTITEDAVTEDIITGDTASNSSSGGGGVEARQEVFLAASRRRRSKRAYNRVDREMKEKYQKYRVAGMCSGTTAARATASESASTSSKPALPTASVVSHNVRAPGATWQGLATLRTGPSTCQKLTKKKAPTGT